MLTELVVDGLGVIARAELALGPGSAALTGETGAGKTLVVAALGLLLGGRADRTLIRDGAPEARVEARFVLAADHDAVGLLGRHGVIERADDPVEVVLSRSVGADGRGKARVNGRLVTVALLREVGAMLVEIAGQHEHHRIGNAAAQRLLLDAFAGPEALKGAREVSDHVRVAARLERELDDLRRRERERERRLDLLRFEIAEIEEADVEPGELARLTAEAARFEHADEIARGLGSAIETLRAEGGVHDRLAATARDVGNVARRDAGSEPLAARLEAAAYEVADVAQELAARIVAPDPGALEAVRARLGVLGRLRRKYGDDESDILAHLGRARAEADDLAEASERIRRTEAERAAALTRAATSARRLSELRRAAARRLEAAVAESLERLALPDARFEVRLAERDLYDGGFEAVEFFVSTNVGEAPRALTRVASGGELARIALALRLLTGGAATTMVFDEVDAGVGGRAAHAVGRSLAELARRANAQVLVVTHLPQVAAFADAHYLVTKKQDNGRTEAVVRMIEGDDRVEELSRMLAGLPESDRAKEHAAELLALAGNGGRR